MSYAKIEYTDSFRDYLELGHILSRPYIEYLLNTDSFIIQSDSGIKCKDIIEICKCDNSFYLHIEKEGAYIAKPINFSPYNGGNELVGFIVNKTNKASEIDTSKIVGLSDDRSAIISSDSIMKTINKFINQKNLSSDTKRVLIELKKSI